MLEVVISILVWLGIVALACVCTNTSNSGGNPDAGDYDEDVYGNYYRS